jgi:hypothetical protein
VSFDAEDEFDEGEVWNNTLVHIGEGLIDSWLRYWVEHWPDMPDRDFLPALDAVRTDVGELLGPEQLKELLDCLCWMYTEQCRAKDPKAKERECAAVLQSCLPEWHRIASEAKPARRPEKRGGKKRK